MKSENLIFKNLENLSYVPPLNDYKSYDEIDSKNSISLISTKNSRKKMQYRFH